MSTPTIFESCRPRTDVLEGNIAEADFAADLAQVIVGKGNNEYLDPVRFFANTYPTRGLKNLLANVCRRLTGSGGEVAAIFRLDTSYGGGKTHGLIALTHAARGLAEVSNVEEFIDPVLLPKGPVRIAAIDGENADPANGRAMGEGRTGPYAVGRDRLCPCGQGRVCARPQQRREPYCARRRDPARTLRRRADTNPSR